MKSFVETIAELLASGYTEANVEWFMGTVPIWLPWRPAIPKPTWSGSWGQSRFGFLSNLKKSLGFL